MYLTFQTILKQLENTHNLHNNMTLNNCFINACIHISTYLLHIILFSFDIKIHVNIIHNTKNSLYN